MNLLFPAMLAGLAGLTLPVILHLIARSRFPVWDFPTIRLLRYEKRDNVFARKLVDPLQLLLRLLVLLLLVLAMARLFLPSFSTRPAPRNLIVVMDASASMRMTAQDSNGSSPETTLERAKRIAARLLREIKLPSRCSLVAVGDKVDVVGPLDPNPELALDALPSIEASDGAGPGLVRAVAQACEMLSGRRETKSQIVVLTDLRRSAFETRNQRDLQEIEALQGVIGDALEIIVVDVGAADAANVAIVAARLRGRHARLNDDAHIITRVRNTGSSEQTAKLTLTMAGQQQPPSREVKLQPGEEAVLDLTARVRRRASSFAALALQAKDAIPHDNKYSVPFVTAPPRLVLIVNGAAEADETDWTGSAIAAMGGEGDEGEWAEEDVIGGAQILQYALNPARSLHLESGGTGVKTEVVTPDVFQIRTLTNYDVIIFYDVSTISTTSRRDLDNFIREGRSLFIISSGAVRNGVPTLNAVEFNDCFFKAGIDDAGKPYGVFSPAKLGVDRAFEPAIGMRLSDSHAANGEKNISYSPGLWLAPFKDQSKGGMAAVSITKAREVVELDDGANVLLQGTGGEILAVEITRGHGRVVLMCFGVELSQSNVAMTRVFPPMMWRLIDYLTGKLRLKPSDTLVAGEPGALDASEAAFSASEMLELVRIGGDATAAAMKKKTGDDKPGEDSSRLSRRRLLTISDQKTVMVDGMPVGHYKLQKKRSASGLAFAGGGSARPITVNADLRESDLTRVDENELQKIFTGAARVLKPEETVGLAPMGLEAWHWVVALLIAAYFIEAISAYIIGVLRAKKLEAQEAEV